MYNQTGRDKGVFTLCTPRDIEVPPYYPYFGVNVYLCSSTSCLTKAAIILAKQEPEYYRLSME